MRDVRCDIAILGSGFAASITALILQRIGLSAILIDKAAHPRFAIGESSTPAANMVLRSLALRYDLPRLLPLARFGSWQQSYPQLGCGLKRGFSYFQQEPGQPFRPRQDHANELLVAASSSDELSDTHWLRADVDHFLINEVRESGIEVWERTAIENIQHSGTAWSLSTQSERGARQITAKFLIDGTGEAGLLPKTLGIFPADSSLWTHSRTIFSHFHNMKSWHAMLEASGAKLLDHPFCCDDAAQHLVLDGAWVWVLRFTNNLTSLGIVLDDRRYPLVESQSAENEWQAWLGRYPSLAELLENATIADRPGRIIRTGRLQRCWRQIAGDNWALLPHTAGFIDPLNSTGIAHSLCGVERLTRSLEEHWQRRELAASLSRYDEMMRAEIAHIDRLVAGCFQTFGHFDLFVAYSMLFFAAATRYERVRGNATDFQGAFLGADDPVFTGLVTENYNRLTELIANRRQPSACRKFEQQLLQGLAPYNHVGLGDPSVQNMYRHTAPI